jgi:hypothetical protein
MQGMRGKRLRKICSQMSLQRSDVRGAMKFTPAIGPATRQRSAQTPVTTGAATYQRKEMFVRGLRRRPQANEAET